VPLLFALCSEGAWGSSCEPVDLRGPALGAVRDQGAVGWCYAFSVADLLSHHTGVRVSAGALAVNYEGHRARQGGFAHEVLDQALRNGICPIDRFNVEGRNIDDESGSGFFTTERMLHIINREIGRDLESHAEPMLEHLRVRERLERSEAEERQLQERAQTKYFWQRWFDADAGPARERVRTQIQDLRRRLNELEELRCQNQLNESPNLEWITPLLTLMDRIEISAEYVRREALSRNPELNLPLLLAQRVCRPLQPVRPQARIVTSRKGVRHPVVPTPRPRTTDAARTTEPPSQAKPFRPHSSEEHLDHSLSSGRPLIINYDINPILREGAPRYSTPHSSTLVGRRRNPDSGQCEYLLRNSWGEHCEIEGQARYRFPCEQGNIWVPSDVVLRMHTELISLAP
jgi:hypothetical protein